MSKQLLDGVHFAIQDGGPKSFPFKWKHWFLVSERSQLSKNVFGYNSPQKSSESFFLDVATLTIWARGETRLDHIGNKEIRKEAYVIQFETFLENERLKWFGHCLRREPNHIVYKIAKTRGLWEKEPMTTEKEMEGQHTRRHEDIPTD